MKIWTSSLLILLFGLNSDGALLPTRFVIGELVKNSGQGVYQIEQDVTINDGPEPLVFREVWTVESENTMKVVVSGLRQLKSLVNFEFLYVGGQRFSLVNNQRMVRRTSDDFLDKYFHFRQTDRLLTEFVRLKIMPPAVLSRPPAKQLKEISYQAEPFVRFSRVGGGVAFAWGLPAPLEGALPPGVWVDQRQFALRKLRVPSGVETAVEAFFNGPRNWLGPHSRWVRWGQKSAQVQTISVVARKDLPADFWSSGGLKSSSFLSPQLSTESRAVIEEFYSRLR